MDQIAKQKTTNYETRKEKEKKGKKKKERSFVLHKRKNLTCPYVLQKKFTIYILREERTRERERERKGMRSRARCEWFAKRRH